MIPNSGIWSSQELVVSSIKRTQGLTSLLFPCSSKLSLCIDSPEIIQTFFDVSTEYPRGCLPHVALETGAEDDHVGIQAAPVIELQTGGREAPDRGVRLDLDLQDLVNSHFA